ncbi:unnamed protein product [Calypogeia fissa]
METKDGLHQQCAVFGDVDYLPLEALSLTLNKDNLTESGSSFTLCFWIYLLKSSGPGLIIRQGRPDRSATVPLLELDVERRLVLHPLRGLDCKYGEASSEKEFVVSDQVCPLEKWVHVGCEIGSAVSRLHMVGAVVGERHVSSPLEVIEGIAKEREEVFLFGGQNGHAASTSGFVYYVRLLPQPTVTNHYVKNPPLELLLDGPSGASDDHELEEGGDGVWSVVGGKASCRRNFALDVALLDALGRSVPKEMELVAFLVFADTSIPVEKPKDDAEAPLLTTFDGVEFPSPERPIKLVHGRASFKLKISQLSSKCDNRLFRVCFNSPNAPQFPFLQAFSRPIRCVSRNRNHRMPGGTQWKQPPAAASSLPRDGSVSSSGLDETIPAETSQHSVRDNRNTNTTAAPTGKDLCYSNAGQPPLKRTRTRLPKESSMPVGNGHGSVQHCSSDSRLGMMPPNEDVGSGLSSRLPLQSTLLPAASVAGGFNWPDTPSGMSVRIGTGQAAELRGANIDMGTTKQETLTEGSNLSTSTDGSKLSQRWNNTTQLPDHLVFKYCLESMHGRGEFLKAFVMSTGEQELTDFAERVSQLTGCRHDGYQILIARNLVFSGNEVWSKVSQESVPPLWTNAVRHVEKSFTTTAGCVNRSLSAKDTEFLKRIAGCAGEFISREEFGRLWNWIFPVALAVKSSQLRTTWDNEDPRWIEGMISREDVEGLLRDGGATSKPGTFLLRFASSRLWPHPDSGALVVSYVDRDMRVNHKLLSLDDSSGFNSSQRPLLDQLLLQPELTQLCRVPSRNAAG